jgi:hypothetical protein
MFMFLRAFGRSYAPLSLESTIHVESLPDMRSITHLRLIFYPSFFN